MLPARAFRQTTFNTVNSLRQLTKNHHVLFRQPFTKRSLQTSNLNLCSLPPRRFSRSAPKRQLSEGPPAQPNYNPTPNLNSPEASLTLTQRMRKLSREYGWSAVGVYFLLTALDFPICFIAVRSLGTERIGGWEHKIIEWVKRAIPLQIPARWRGIEAGVEEAQDALGGNVPGYDHGVKAAERANAGESASIWTQLAFAYAIHKSFIFLRVPLTAAVTPKVVRVLRGWGWDIGKRKSKSTATSTASKSGGKV